MCWKYKINTIVQNHHGNWRQSLETVVVSWFCCNKNTRTCKYCGNTRHLITSHVTMAICITFTVAMVNSCTFYSMSKSPRVKSNLIKEHPKITDSWCNIVQECFESTWLLGKPLCILVTHQTLFLILSIKLEFYLNDLWSRTPCEISTSGGKAL